jgi:streptomycin 6-kinase
MQEVYGAAGVEWLQQLPALLAECEQRWSLTIMPPFAPLSYNYVAPARLPDGRDIVLKVGFPSAELVSEMEALRLYDGHGIARLLDSDRERGVLLLERLNPGTMLSNLTDHSSQCDAPALEASAAGPPIPHGREVGVRSSTTERAFRRYHRPPPLSPG